MKAFMLLRVLYAPTGMSWVFPRKNWPNVWEPLDRTVTSIETETGNPKLDTLYRLIRELHIDANQVFYPELHQSESAISEFTYFLSTCSNDEIRDLYIICKSVLSTLREHDSRKISQNLQPVE